MSKLIAHRGLSSRAFENTEEAFLLAADHSAVFGIETDVWLTKDNILVCSHEPTPFAEPNSVLEIKDSYYDRISKLPLNYKICKYKFKVPHFICTFDRYLEICKEFNKVAVIEIKQAGLDETALTLLVDKVKKANMLNKTHFISFDWESLKKVQLIETKSTVFALADTEQKIQSALDFGFNISIRGNLINKKIMKTVHEKHLLISVWTVNSKFLSSLLQKFYKVDFITSNRIVLK